MTPTPDDYLRAIDAAKKATAKAQDYADTIKDAANKLGTWKHASISNIGGGYPPEVTGIYSTQEIDGREWPTIQQLNDALMGYHRAASHLKNI